DRSDQTRTGKEGRFTIDLDADPGTQRIELAFAGKGPIDGSSFVTTTDPSRATVKLDIKSEDTPDGAKITVHALGDNDSPMTLPVQLFVGPPGDDKLLAPIARIETGTPYALKRIAVGGAGPKHIRATFAGDASTQAASADSTVPIAT